MDITRKISNNSSAISFISLFLLTVGTTITHLYLKSVKTEIAYDVGLLFGGVILQALGITLLVLPLIFSHSTLQNNIYRKIFLFCLLIESFSIAYMPVTRFDLPFQSDAIREFRVASISETSWDIQNAQSYSYLECLSVTIFPSVISHTLNIPIKEVFRFVMPTIVAIMPLVFFATIRRFFGKSPITYLSTLILPAILFFQIYLSFYRGAIATLLLYLFIWALTEDNQRGVILTVLLGFGIISSHLTTGFFAVVLLSSTLLVIIILRWKIKNINVSTLSRRLLLIITMLLAWSIYIAIFHFSRIVQSVWLFITELGISAAPETMYMSDTALNPRGPIVTAWFIIQLLLMVGGGIIGFYRSVKGQFKERETLWVITGCAIGTIILLSSLVEMGTRGEIFIQPTRALAHVLLFATSFMAIVLLKVQGFFRILAIIFIVLILPMNLMLPSHEYDIMFHSFLDLPHIESPVYPLTNWPRGKVSLKTGEWISQHAESGSIHVDLLGYTPVILGTIPDDRIVHLQPLEIETQIQYILVHDLFLKDGLWYGSQGRTRYLRVYDPTIFLNNTELNLIYNNKAYIFLENEKVTR